MTTEVGPFTYVWRDVPRPFVHPVRTPDGRVLSVDSPADHPWHHALWFTIKFVNGTNFWEEYDQFGLLRQQAPPTLETRTDGGRPVVRATSSIDWVDADGESVVVTERCSLTSRVDADAHLLDWDVRLTPTADTRFDRTPFTTWGGYGGLTLRGRPDWHHTRLLLPDGRARQRVLGEHANWCALDGTIGTDDEGRPAGVAMLDHPDNPNHPTPWYASTRADTYGDEGWANFCNAAFLWDAPLEVEAGAELRLRHRVVVHDGEWGTERVERAWQSWLEEDHDRRT